MPVMIDISFGWKINKSFPYYTTLNITPIILVIAPKHSFISDKTARCGQHVCEHKNAP